MADALGLGEAENEGDRSPYILRPETEIFLGCLERAVLSRADRSPDKPRLFQVCLEKPEQLTGLAQFAAFVYQSGRCLESRRLEYLRQAEALVTELIDLEDEEFCSELCLYQLGNRFYEHGHKEEAIASYDQAIEYKPDKHEAWFNRGVSLSALGRREEAIESDDKAIEFKPDYYQAWNNRGCL